ncbi:MAG: amidohydrolase [Candidatus Neomarinimicrobiota bacterium]
MSILIRNVLVNNAEQDIYVEGRQIRKIGNDIRCKADHVLDGNGKAAIPAFINGHTHAAMVLLRGWADDMLLDDWLNKKIWPIESKLTEEDVYWGTRLACLEMIESGTTFFNDMYWHYHSVARAVEDSGIRAAVSAVFIDLFDEKRAREQIDLNRKLFAETQQYSDRVVFTLGPHALYTVSTESLQWARDFAEENGLSIHIHLSETQEEVEDCLRRHKRRPIEYLNDIGFLGPNVIAAHVIWVNEREIELLQEHQVKVIYNPTSNMKLSAGIFPYERLKAANISIALGTDGCASNNNLDMLEAMKFATLLQKLSAKNPATLPAQDVFDLATVHANPVFNLNGGELKEGRLADLLLVDLSNVHMTPLHDLIHNLVYSANGSCIDTTICDGKILMQDRIVEGAEEVKQRAQDVARDLLRR